MADVACFSGRGVLKPWQDLGLEALSETSKAPGERELCGQWVDGFGMVEGMLVFLCFSWLFCRGRLWRCFAEVFWLCFGVGVFLFFGVETGVWFFLPFWGFYGSKKKIQ